MFPPGLISFPLQSSSRLWTWPVSALSPWLTQKTWESIAGWVLLGWASDAHKSCFNSHPFSFPSISRQSFIKQQKLPGFTANILTYLLNNNQGNFHYKRIVWDCLVCLGCLLKYIWNILIYVMMPAGGTKLLKKSLKEQLSWMTNQG